MSDKAVFDCSAADAYATKLVGPSTGYTIIANMAMPSAWLASGIANSYASADFVGAGDPYGSETGLWKHMQTPNQWCADIYGCDTVGAPPAGDVFAPYKLILDTPSGTTWHARWELGLGAVQLPFGGGTYAITLPNSSSGQLQLIIGGYTAANKPLEAYEFLDIYVYDASMSLLFHEDWSTGDFSHWDAVVGAASVVPYTPPAPGVLLASPSSGISAVLRKTLAPATVHEVQSQLYLPALTLSNLSGTGNGADMLGLDFSNVGGNEDAVFPWKSGSVWQWWTEWAPGGPQGVIAAGVPAVAVYRAEYASGTTWNITVSAGGVVLFTYAKDFGVDDSVSPDFILGAYNPPTVGVEQDYYAWDAVARDASHVVFSDLPSTSFAAWTSATGSVSLVPEPVPPPVPPSGIPYHSPEWRFVVGDLVTFEVLSFLDKLASQRVVTYTLNAAAVAEGVVPSDNPEVSIPWPDPDSDPFLTEGTRVLWGLRKEGTPKIWVIRFAGIVMQLEDTAQSDNAYSHFTAYDPWQYLLSRPVCNADGSLPGPNGLSFSATRVDVIAATLLKNTIVNQGACGIDAGVTYGGTAYYTGTIDAAEAIDINFQQGTTVGQAWKQLCDLDLCDIVLLPIYDPINRPGYLVEFNIASQWGEDRDEAIFAWDKPSRSLVGLDRTYSGTERANSVKYFAGQGGSAPGGQTIALQSDAASIAKFGEYWRQQFFPNQTVPAAVEALAQAQLELSKNGRITVVFSPAPERSPIPFTEYFLGDRVPVYASQRFRAPIPQPGLATSDQQNYQRIYGIPIQIADDATEAVQQMLTAVPSS